jgi:hypothetical protein
MFILTSYSGSTVVITRQLGHQERELLGHIDADKGLPGKIGNAVGEREDNLDDVAGAAKLGMVISLLPSSHLAADIGAPRIKAITALSRRQTTTIAIADSDGITTLLAGERRTRPAQCRLNFASQFRPSGAQPVFVSRLVDGGLGGKSWNIHLVTSFVWLTVIVR